MSVHAEALSETKPAAAERDVREGPAVYVEGITAGVVGASIIALWFLLIDTIAGRPFYTPAVLGAALFRDSAALTGEGTVTPSLELVLGFTWVHYLIFVLIGVGAARLLDLAEHNPNAGFGIVILFAVFEFGFLLVSMVFAEGILQRLAWPAVVVGNLLAAAGMCWTLWRHHRGLTIEP